MLSQEDQFGMLKYEFDWGFLSQYNKQETNIYNVTLILAKRWI